MVHVVYACDEITYLKKKGQVVSCVRRARQVISPPHCDSISSRSICSLSCRQNVEVSCVCG